MAKLIEMRFSLNMAFIPAITDPDSMSAVMLMAPGIISLWVLSMPNAGHPKKPVKKICTPMYGGAESEMFIRLS